MTLPFGRIALSLSGGGSRAAGFHLGTLEYLDRVDILKDVTILSTVSGGSFVGASYAFALKTAPPDEDLHVTFARYFETFRRDLLKTKLIAGALGYMGSGRLDVPSGRHNLVTALAQVYDDTFLHQGLFGVFWNDRKIHLKEIIFNATEFETGNAFRFQKGEHSCQIGNDDVHVSDKHVKKMRLADVVASSSCIPIGLEPLMFPDDFRWPDADTCARIKEELKQSCGKEAIPIMDGGVYDNQGIESVLLAVRRDQRHEPLGLPPRASLADWFARLLAAAKSADADLGTLIISDTPLMTDNALAAAMAPTRKGVVTLQHLNLATLALIGMALTTVVYLVGQFLLGDDGLHPLSQVDDFFVYAIPLALALILIVVLVAVRRTVKKVLADFPQSNHHAWADLRRLKVATVIEMVRLRFSSTWALTSWVYFKRIRQLGYELVLALPEARRHLMQHEIGDLRPGVEATLPDGSTLPDWLKPSPNAQVLADFASTYPTMLWFEKDDEDLDRLTRSGRMTMCFNILAHLQQKGTLTAEQQKLFDLARADWAQLQADPMAELSPRAAEVRT